MNSAMKKIMALMIFTMVALLISAQAPVLVKDIRTDTETAGLEEGTHFTELGNYIVFSGKDLVHGVEPWAFNKTTKTVTLLADTSRSDLARQWLNLAVLGNTCFFDSSQGLWKTDGTPENTTLLKPSLIIRDIEFVTWNDAVYFVAFTSNAGDEIWRTDGTEAGTYAISDIPGEINIHELGATTDYLYFSLTQDIDRRELWKSDGSKASTQLVKTIGNSAENIVDLTALGHLLLFKAQDSTHGTELWRSDGTTAGTFVIRDLIQGGNGSYPDSLYLFNGNLYFSVYTNAEGRELWKTKGTYNSTVLVKDIVSGTGSSDPDIIGVMNNKLMFLATTPASGKELWETDGTVSGTKQAVELTPGSGSTPFYSKIIFKNHLFFGHDADGSGNKIWESDGTLAGTHLWMDLILPTPAWGYEKISATATTLFLVHLQNNAHELYYSDDLTAPAYSLGSTQSKGSFPNQLTANQNSIFFVSEDNTHGKELYKSDGTTANTSMLLDIKTGANSSAIDYITPIGSNTFFVAEDNTHGVELWLHDGSSTNMVKDIVSNAGSSSPEHLTNLDGTLFFTIFSASGINQLWKSDGTTAGTTMVLELGDVAPRELAVFNHKLYFAKTDATYGNELWVTDGSTSSMLKDIYAGPDSSLPYRFNVLQNKLVFVAQTAASGLEMWSTDGTAGGTIMVKELTAGPNSTDFGVFASDRSSYVYFSVAVNGTRNIYFSDGTSGNTAIIATSNHYNDVQMCIAGSQLYFTAYEASTGWELYKGSHTAGQYQRVIDLWPGPFSPEIGNLYAAGDVITFFANTPGQGFALWATRGTALGTWPLADLAPGPNSMYRGSTVHSQNTLYFSSSATPNDVEFYKVNLGPSNAMDAPEYVCQGTSFNASVENSALIQSYLWNIAGGTITAGQGTAQVACTPTSTNPVQLTCVVMDINGLSNTASREVSIRFPEPATSIHGPTTVCAQESDLVYWVDTVPGAASYQWTLPAGATMIEDKGASIRIKWGTQAGNIAVNIDRCSIPGTMTLQVNLNAANQSANAGSDRSLCIGDTIVLAANTPSSWGTGLWSIQSGPDFSHFQFSNVSSETSSFTPFKAGNYVLRWTLHEPCNTSFDDMNLEVNAPIIASAGPDQTFSALQSATLAATDPSPASGTWNVISGPSNSSAQFSNIMLPTATFTPQGGFGVYTLRWTVNGGSCGSDSDDVTISFLATVDLSLTIGVSTPVPVINERLTLDLNLLNAGTDPAFNVVVEIRLPQGVILNSVQSPPIGTFNPITSLWSIPLVPPGPNIFSVNIINRSLPIKSIAVEILLADTPDPDSTPGNGILAEDDQDQISLFPLDSIYFPDPMVRNYVYSDPGIDMVDDDNITTAEAQGAIAFICIGCGIQDLEGVEYFSNLLMLFAIDNSISNLPNLSQLANLEDVNLYNNKITSLRDDSGYLLPQTLVSLALGKNQLTTMDPDIFSNPFLRTLEVSENPIQNLPDLFFTLPSLTFLNINAVQVTSLPLSIAQLTTLEELYVDNNHLSSLPDLSQLTNLTTLSARLNKLSILPDLTGLTQLTALFLDNNHLIDLTSLTLHPTILTASQHAVDVSGNWLGQGSCPDIQILRNRANLSNAFFNYQIQGNFSYVPHDYMEWLSQNERLQNWVLEVTQEPYLFDLTCP